VSDPAAELVALLTALDPGDLPAGLNLYPAPQEDIVAPAIVIRPSVDWFLPHGFCNEDEHWDALPVVSASTPGDGIKQLRSITRTIIRALAPPFGWERVDGPVIDETTGVPFLANRIRLTYQSGDS
jgi:hypothetical protein